MQLFPCDNHKIYKAKTPLPKKNQSHKLIKKPNKTLFKPIKKAFQTSSSRIMHQLQTFNIAEKTGKYFAKAHKNAQNYGKKAAIKTLH